MLRLSCLLVGCLVMMGGCAAPPTGKPAPKATPEELSDRRSAYERELDHLAKNPASAPKVEKLWRGETREKLISLSFDDGPRPEWIEKLLTILKANDVKATFYLVGKMVKLNPDQARKIAADGHEIGNHSYSHPNLSKVSDQDVLEEILAAQNTIRSVTGVTPVTMRPPGGNISQAVLAANRKAGLVAIEGTTPAQLTTRKFDPPPQWSPADGGYVGLLH
ncbi:MAG: polysaccharide deacetylase family protein [Fimbriimonadaceae bacterium]|nr:polysaccharide deacetylase family protein [Fimbriimonadaceae bacterium]